MALESATVKFTSPESGKLRVTHSGAQVIVGGRSGPATLTWHWLADYLVNGKDPALYGVGADRLDKDRLYDALKAASWPLDSSTKTSATGAAERSSPAHFFRASSPLIRLKKGEVTSACARTYDAKGVGAILRALCHDQLTAENARALVGLAVEETHFVSTWLGAATLVEW